MKASTILLIALLTAIVAASFVLGYKVGYGGDGRFEKPDTVTIEKWKRDTIYEPKDSLIVKFVKVPFPVHDTTTVHDTTAIHDSVLVDVPIWEKSYVSQNYNLTIRGFQPELVNIWIKQKDQIITVPYRKKWSFTVGPQAGVGITPKGVQPYAGAGITFGYSF